MNIRSIDHLVLTVRDIERTVAFYTSVLGMQKREFAGGRIALFFGSQKINLHQKGAELSPHAQHPTDGSADICLLTDTPLEQAMREVEAQGISIIEGPVKRSGARGAILSFYLRDPDGNLIEVSNE